MRGAGRKSSGSGRLDAATPRGAHYLLRLFVVGSNPRSQRTIESLRRICDERLNGRVDLEIADLYSSRSSRA